MVLQYLSFSTSLLLGGGSFHVVSCPTHCTSNVIIFKNRLVDVGLPACHPHVHSNYSQAVSISVDKGKFGCTQDWLEWLLGHIQIRKL